MDVGLTSNKSGCLFRPMGFHIHATDRKRLTARRIWYDVSCFCLSRYKHAAQHERCNHNLLKNPPLGYRDYFWRRKQVRSSAGLESRLIRSGPCADTPRANSEWASMDRWFDFAYQNAGATMTTQHTPPRDESLDILLLRAPKRTLNFPISVGWFSPS